MLKRQPKPESRTESEQRALARNTAVAAAEQAVLDAAVAWTRATSAAQSAARSLFLRRAVSRLEEARKQ